MLIGLIVGLFVGPFPLDAQEQGEHELGVEITDDGEYWYATRVRWYCIPVNQVESSWTYLTNHSHVLICIAEDPSARLRDLAQRVGITERAVQMIVQDLEQAGVVEKRRTGRRNHYEIRPDHALRHPVEQHRTVRELLELLTRHSPAL